jgi:hypothetical protein
MLDLENFEEVMVKEILALRRERDTLKMERERV